MDWSAVLKHFGLRAFPILKIYSEPLYIRIYKLKLINFINTRIRKHKDARVVVTPLCHSAFGTLTAQSWESESVQNQGHPVLYKSQ